MITSSLVKLHYCLAGTLLTIYGVQVCPFLESLSRPALAVPVLLTFACLLLVRKGLAHWLLSKHVSTQVKTQFITDNVLFMAGGLALATFNYTVHEFPAGSGLKVLFGTFILGFFVSCFARSFS